MFAREDGQPIPPERVTKRFAKLVAEAVLRHVRLHDLRHGRAPLLLVSGTDIVIVSKVLGHSSISITSDTYSHLLGASAGRLLSGRAAWFHVPTVASRRKRVTKVSPHRPLAPRWAP